MSEHTTCPVCGIMVGFDHTGAMNRHGTLDTGECPGGRAEVTAEGAAMKVNLSYTVEIDQEAWSREYGLSAGEVRADVKSHLEGMAREWLESLGLGR